VLQDSGGLKHATYILLVKADLVFMSSLNSTVAVLKPRITFRLCVITTKGPFFSLKKKNKFNSL
jgi:hypothetical protein